MPNQKNVVEILRRELPYLRDSYHIKRLGIFGSFAKQKQKANSDVDIIVEFDTPIGIGFIDLAEHIEKLLGRKVDIITNEGVKSIRVREVVEDIKRSVRYV